VDSLLPRRQEHGSAKREKFHNQGCSGQFMMLNCVLGGQALRFWSFLFMALGGFYRGRCGRGCGAWDGLVSRGGWGGGGVEMCAISRNEFAGFALSSI